jgi:Skp family chaperone for outer membrane proteins
MTRATLPPAGSVGYNPLEDTKGFTTMTRRRIVVLAVTATALAVALSAGQARAQAQPVRIAVVNTAKVFNEMQEFKDLSQKLEAERRDLQAQAKQRETDIQQLEQERDVFRPDSPQYQEAQQKYLGKAIELRTWGEMTQADQQRRYKLEMRRLFDKLQTAAADLARERGIGLVLTQRRPDIDLEKVNMEQLKSAIMQTDVLYVAPEADITNDLIAQLDARYKQGQ